MSLTKERIHTLIKECQAEAEKAIQEGNPPFGCVITDMNGVILTKTHNTRNTSNDPTAHAEIKALRHLGTQRKNWQLEDCVLFANAESCPMCLSAAIKSRVKTYYFGAPAEGDMNPMLTVGEVAAKATSPLTIHSGILGDECAKQIAGARAATANKPKNT